MLRNRLGITSKQAMADAEARALQRATDRFIGTFDAMHRFTAAFVCEMHRVRKE